MQKIERKGNYGNDCNRKSKKAGFWKTTSTINLGVSLAQHKKKVLLVDLDPQAHVFANLKMAGLWRRLVRGKPLRPHNLLRAIRT